MKEDVFPLARLSEPAFRYLSRHKNRSRFLSQAPNLKATLICAGKNETLTRFLLREMRCRLFLYTAEYERTGGDPLQSAYLWSQFADEAIKVADNLAILQLSRRYFKKALDLKLFKRCILAFGKLGSFELNPSSDIDLLFFYEKSDIFSLHQVSIEVFYDKWVRIFRSILHDIDAHHFVFRVDLDLRPDGVTAGLVNSIEGLIKYYHKKGRTWERLIFLRARAVVDPSTLSDHFFSEIHTFLYPLHSKSVGVVGKKLENYRSFEFVRHMALIREQIGKKVAADCFDLKSSAGGIRDIEFIAQVHQLIDSQNNSLKRATPTMTLLQDLSSFGLLGDEIMLELAFAYRWYRRLEHALQYIHDEQSQRMPQDLQQLSNLVYFLRGHDPFLTVEDLKSKNHKIQQRIREIADAFFKTSSFKPEKKSKEAALPEEISCNKSMMLEFESSTVMQTQRLKERIESLSSYLKRLASASSNFSAEYFQEKSPQSRKYWCSQIRDHRSLELQKKLWLKLSLDFIDRRVELFKVLRILSHFAEAAIRHYLECAIIEVKLAAKVVQPESAQFCIASMGRLGIKELGFLSDLDLFYICNSKAQDSQQTLIWATAVARCFSLSLKKNSMFKLDYRLRPHGEKGPLVVSYQGLKNYHFSHSKLWERQSLLRMRAVAGDRMLCKKLQRIKNKLITRQNVGNIGSELLSMRAKMLSELEYDQGFHLKLGDGGLVDIEFALQALQLNVLLKGHKLKISQKSKFLDFVDQHHLFTHEADFLTDAYEKIVTLYNYLLLLDPIKGAEITKTDIRLQRGVGLLNRFFPRIYSGEDLYQQIQNLAAQIREMSNHILMRLS